MAKFTNMDKAKAKLLGKSPFFATLLLGTPLIENRDIPTAATDGKRIFYNPEFMSSLPVEVVQFVLAHELGHMMYEHVARRNNREHRLFNIAGDYVINWLLKEDGFTLWNEALVDAKYADMSTEQVYRLLQEEREKQKKGGQGDKGKRPGDGGHRIPGQGKGGEPGDDDDLYGGFGDDLMNPEGGQAQAEQDAGQMRGRVAQAAHAARMAGKLSGGLERLVGEVLNPKVRWEDLLRDYMTRTAKDDETWRVRNRRFSQVYLPARYSERIGEIIVIGDTSGSIGEEELNQVAAEVTAISEQLNPERVRMVWADTKVAGEQVFEAGEPLEFKPGGGGGTDMRVPLQHVEQYDPEIVVLITDGYTPWPTTEPPYPLIVCCTTNVDVPVGDVVRL